MVASLIYGINNQILQKEFEKSILKHQNKISRVTLWGVQDGQSWKNNFPVSGSQVSAQKFHDKFTYRR